MLGDYVGADPSCCIVHGPGARTQRWFPQYIQRTAGLAASWWECLQCMAVFQQALVFGTSGGSYKLSPTEGLQSLVEAAKAAKVVLYDDPRELDYESLEEGVRAPCRRINECGWCFTAESCHGHVHEDDRYGGVWGDDPFLRLTARRADFGHMLELFGRAMEFEEIDPRVPGFSQKHVLSYNTARDLRGDPDFGSAIVRIPASRVYVRRLALEAFGRFAELVNTELP